MRILVTDGMDKTAMAKLRELGHEVVEQFYEPDALGAALREFDAVVVRSKTKIRANHIDEAKGGKLKLIIRGGVGVDNIDVKYAEENGITVKNTPKASSESVAELALGHMFSCARYLSIAGHTMREDKWEKKAYGKGIELRGKTLGIVGFGRIGQHLGVMAKAIGMDVIAFDIFHIPGIEEKLGIPYVEMDERRADQCGAHREDEGRRRHHQHLPRHERRRGGAARRSRERQGPRGRSRRLRRRARHQQGALQPSDGLLHAAHRRRDRRSPEAHRRGDRRHHLGVLRQFSVQSPLSRCIIRSKLTKILYSFYDYFSSAT